MDREKLQQLILKDNLKAVLQKLLKLPAKAKAAKLLNGRLLTLNEQHIQGTISNEGFNVEKNKIRVAILSLIEEETPDTHKVTTTDKTTNLRTTFKWLLLLPVLVGGLWFIAPLSKEAPPAKLKNISSPLSYTVKGLNFEATREYTQVLGYIMRGYNWQVDVPVTVNPADIELIYHDSINTLVVQVKRVLLSTAFFIKNKKSKTIKHHLWIEHTSKDGQFWEGINKITKGRISGHLDRSYADKNRIKAYFKKVLISKIKALNPDIITDKTNFDIKFNALHLYNRSTTRL